MTREEITSAYDVDEHGIIRSPGKFQAEMLYAPYFIDTASYGEEISVMEDGCGDYASPVEIDDDDRREFPELGTAKYVLITENDLGFVGTQLVETEEDANKARAMFAPEDEQERLTCPDCELVAINGVVCHETGCPNANARYDTDSGEWTKQRKCFECGYMVDHDDPCCSAP